jgi:hypothetical protein
VAVSYARNGTGALYARAIDISVPRSRLLQTTDLSVAERHFRNLAPQIVGWAERIDLHPAWHGLPLTADPIHWSRDYVSAPTQRLCQQPTILAASRAYRSGPMTPSQHQGEVAELYALADEVRPAGRASRSACLFASPSLFGASRWLRANAMLVRHPMYDFYGADWAHPEDAAGKLPEGYQDVRIREIEVADPRTVFCYPVEAWDRASRPHGYLSAGAERTSAMAAYWESGVALADWPTVRAAGSRDDRDYEVLLDPADILSARLVEPGQIVRAVPANDWTRDELERLCYPNRFRYGSRYWRRPRRRATAPRFGEVAATNRTP